MISRRNFMLVLAASAMTGAAYAQRVPEITVYLNPT